LGFGAISSETSDLRAIWNRATPPFVEPSKNHGELAGDAEFSGSAEFFHFCVSSLQTSKQAALTQIRERNRWSEIFNCAGSFG